MGSGNRKNLTDIEDPKLMKVGNKEVDPESSGGGG